MGRKSKIYAKQELGDEQFNNSVDYVKNKYLLSIDDECSLVRRNLKKNLHNIHKNKSMMEVFSFLSALTVGATGFETINSIINSDFNMSTVGLFSLIAICTSSAATGYGLAYKKCKKRVLDYIYNRLEIIKKLDNNKYKIDNIEMGDNVKDTVVDTAVEMLSKKYSGTDYILDR